MLVLLSGLGERLRVVCVRLLRRFGLREDSFLIVPAAIIGIVTAFAAVGFHELIYKIRDLLYANAGAELLYGHGLGLLILFPAVGGLLVGIVSRYVTRSGEGHGVIDVIESVARSSGFVRPGVAIEKIFTSALTLGTGGSGGAEGPIVQIGAAIASGVGQLFRFARHQMPIIIGCGSAAGISAIFNSPIGGVVFTLEVILQEFSIRTFTPLVIASVIANVTTRAIFARIKGQDYPAIFAMPASTSAGTAGQLIDWLQVGNFVFLGLMCGLAGVTLTKLMPIFEARFKRLSWLPGGAALRPALGGALLGVVGIAYVLIFGRLLLHQPKPFAFEHYPMPAFYGDGYGVIQMLLGGQYYAQMDVAKVLLLLAFLSGVKILATCLTLASGGSGGIIAPSLFIGATAGGCLGVLLRQTGWFAEIRPEVYALVGMGAVLAAVVHAPLASILILFELTQDYRVTLPAMLATVVATGAARLIHPHSIYTQALRTRGVKFAGTGELNLLRRLSVEQVQLEPAAVVQAKDSVQRLIDLTTQLGTMNFVVIDEAGAYRGMVSSQELNLAMMERDAVPLMIVQELMRGDVPVIRHTDDLAGVFEIFWQTDLTHLPVCLAGSPHKVIGLISRAAVLKAYQQAVGG
ncbi:chloride channel protein [Fontivita pretiosa]|uniref:chloride channel protein n=1 Tax=Fontivita pretiosa TaxID=2989684 RepID=UPI003D175C20